MELKPFRELETPKVEKRMLNWLDKVQTDRGSLYESMKYSLAAGGKRIRPMLLLAVIESLGGNVEEGYDAAVALEYVHTYSLIHDDLPAMDDDALRRGKPTNHIVYGEAVAILAGDALLTQAFEVIARSSLSSEQKTHLILALAKAAGANGMVAGQVKDIEGEGKELSLDDLKHIHRKKTGALIEFAVIAAGAIEKVSAEVQDKLIAFADHFGLAFQIRDDILDVIGSVEELGKNVGMDAHHEKNTYPELMTLEGAKKALEEELNEANQVLQQIKALYSDEGKTVDMILLKELVDSLRIKSDRVTE